jgi:nitroimidazol reductase NimA-like FMN-containing flavoprotein (pyridoxamine 5'-phosphate oxidase superfamily)
MRRKEREITSIEDRLAIIARCRVCRLGLSENDNPYVVPLNYGYSFEANVLTLYFHGAGEGRKSDIIRKNNRACFEIDCDGELREGTTACNYGYSFKSVIGFGVVTVSESPEEKNFGLKRIMKHQTGRDMERDFTEAELKTVTVYRMEVREFTGKRKNFG